MAEPFIGEIAVFGFDYAPRDWARCDGGLVPVSQNPALYALLGTQFGGNGTTNFAYPDFRGRAPVHSDPRDPYTYRIGTFGGLESVTLTLPEMASHTHEFYGAPDDADKNAPASGRSLAVATQPIYSTSVSSMTAMSPLTCTFTGGGGSHTNVQPSQVLNFCIALQGIFPPRN